MCRMNWKAFIYLFNIYPQKVPQGIKQAVTHEVILALYENNYQCAVQIQLRHIKNHNYRKTEKFS